MTGATSGAEHAFSYRPHEPLVVFVGFLLGQSLVFCVVLGELLFDFSSCLLCQSF